MKRKLEKKINLILSLVIIVVLLPLIVTIMCQGMRLEHLMKELPLEQNPSPVLSAVGTESGETTPESVREGKSYAAAEDGAEGQIIGIVAKEIGAGSSTQAILAQCVIARTSFYDAKRTGTAEPEALSDEEMSSLWGEDYEKVYQSLKECVDRTKGEVLMYQDHYIYAAYHAVSAGKTRNMSELYADADMPYLKECACQEDTAADGYLAVLYWEKEEFLENCKTLFPESPPESLEQIRIESRDSAGYVQEISVGSGSYSGEEFRVRWKLNSACFTVTESGEQVRIVTKGLGHGFGLSQYSANLMAADGKSYEEILAYFYPGAELINMDETSNESI